MSRWRRQQKKRMRRNPTHQLMMTLSTTATLPPVFGEVIRLAARFVGFYFAARSQAK